MELSPKLPLWLYLLVAITLWFLYHYDTADEDISAVNARAVENLREKREGVDTVIWDNPREGEYTQ